MSATATWIMCIVIVGSLVGMLTVITLAARHPGFRNPRVPSAQGPVLGGTHFAEGGRSVAPDRDAPAEFTDTELHEIQVAETGHPQGPRLEIPAQQMPIAPGLVPPQQGSDRSDQEPQPDDRSQKSAT